MKHCDMGFPVTERKPKDLQVFLSQNFGVLMTFGSFLVLVIRLILLAHGHTQTAIYILAHADKVPLLVGLIIPVVPVFCVFSCLSIVYLWNRGELKVADHLRVPIVSISVLLGAVGVWTGRWNALIGVILFEFAFFFVPALDLISKWLNRKNPSYQPAKRSFQNEKLAPGLALYMFFILCLIYPGPNWLPGECVRNVDKSSVSAVVLASDVKFTYLLTTDGQLPLIISTDKIANRSVISNTRFQLCKPGTLIEPNLSNSPTPTPTIRRTK